MPWGFRGIKGDFRGDWVNRLFLTRLDAGYECFF